MRLIILYNVIQIIQTLFFTRTLAQFLRAQTKPLIEKEILRMFSQMVDALLYLHGHKILHRYAVYLHCLLVAHINYDVPMYMQRSEDRKCVPH